MACYSINSRIFYTPNNTPYLKKPGIILLSAPRVKISRIKPFLTGFNKELGFLDYLADPVKIKQSEELCKFAGQLCYMSFGPRRTKNEKAEDYFKNIKSSGHGSVLEHANFSFLFYGVSRSFTHELVRHRAGFAYSQVSQRYTDKSTLRFVERPEYQRDKRLHQDFIGRIDRVANDYENLREYLIKRQVQDKILSAELKTDLRKKINQASRSILSNEVEAPIVVTANLRAWRHFLEARASIHAEIEMRNLAIGVYKILSKIAPAIFNDHEVEELDDGTLGLKTIYRKV